MDGTDSFYLCYGSPISNVSILSPSQGTLQSIQPMNKSESISLYVKLHHQVPFGKSIYMVGNCPELGDWQPEPKCKLHWTQNHNWRRMIPLPDNKQIHYKFVVGSDRNDQPRQLEWEDGADRVIDSRFSVRQQMFSDQKWNLQKVRIDLLVNADQDIEMVYILGNCVDLGMKLSKRRLNRQTKIIDLKGIEKQVWSICFTVEKHKTSVNYYYFAKINGNIEKIREPGNHFYLDSKNNLNSFGREAVEYQPGLVNIRQTEDFKGFRISQLNEHIYIGPYIKKREDIEVLKEHKVKAILNLQSSKDMDHYKVDWNCVKQMADQNQISAHNFQIVDMNFSDFVNKSSDALQLLRNLVSNYGCVYLHCTAGIFRSPQLAILYLVKFQNYDLTDAIHLMSQKRPLAHPYKDCLSCAIYKAAFESNPAKSFSPNTVSTK